MNVSPSSGSPRVHPEPVPHANARRTTESAQDPRDGFLALFPPGDAPLAERLLERVKAPAILLETLTPAERGALLRPEVCAGLQACAEASMPDGFYEAALDAASLADITSTRRILENFPKLSSVRLSDWTAGPHVRLTGLGERITSIVLLGTYPPPGTHFHVREGVHISADLAPAHPSALAQVVAVDNTGAERTLALGYRKAGKAPTAFKFLEDHSSRLREVRAVASLVCMPLELRLRDTTLDLSRSDPGDLDRLTVDAWLVFRAEHPELAVVKLPAGFEFGFRLGDDLAVRHEPPPPKCID